MQIREYGENLIQLTRLWSFNCFLVREEDGFTLVDTGLPGSGSDILKAAQGYGLPIRRVTLTHAHGDHVGSLDQVSSQLPGAEIAFTQRTAEYLKGNLYLEPDEPQEEIRGSFYTRQTKPTRYLQLGDLIGSLKVYPAPGHTPDQIAFLDERDGTLIAGDAFQTKGRVAVAGTVVWSFPFPGMAAWHKGTSLDTAQKLTDLKPTRLAVGHGNVVDNPGDAMKKALVRDGQG